VQHVKNNNKEEAVWLDSELSGLINDWQTILKGKITKIKLQ
jgi:hypothetical protein